MPEYLAPGVYVEEVSFRFKSIEGVSTSTCAYVGPTRKGPVTRKGTVSGTPEIITPEIITSFGEFERMYGGLENLSFTSGNDSSPNVTNYLAHAVRVFFDNGGKRLYIGRCFVPRTDGGGAVTSDGVASAKVVDNGANSVDFFARAPGSGGNGRVRLFEKKTRITPDVMSKAPSGSLLCVGGTTESPAQPARAEGGTPPFSLNNGDQLGLILSSGTQRIVFEGTAAEARATAAMADPVTIEEDTTLIFFINDVRQSITLNAREDWPLTDLINTINVNMRHGYARLEEVGGDNRLVIGSDKRGLGARVRVPPVDILGFTEEVTDVGDGNVQDLEAITIEEINDLLEEENIQVRASLPPSTRRLTLATTDTGSTMILNIENIENNDAHIALGLPTLTQGNRGQDGATLLYYEKRGQAWVGGANGSTILDPSTMKKNAEIVTVNLEAEDADGKTFLYEDLGLSASHPRYLGHALRETPSNRADALQNPYYFRINGSIDIFELRTGLFGSESENSFELSGGNDGAEPTSVSNVTHAVSYTDALKVLEDIDDISIIAAPGHSALEKTTFKAVQDALISHAEQMKYRIAVLDTPPKQTISGARDARGRIDSTYAALYYPWIYVANPLARPGNEQIPREISLPPSGFVTGIYARTDINRGVWKAPANEVIRGTLRFEREINHGQQEVLNPEGINCLRFFFGRGNRVWGARTASSDPEWKYVNVRRYFIYLEHSIDRSTQWAVFEPNGPLLWSNIIDTVSAFLYDEWRSGALLGSTPEEAFFVRCDRSTMTQADLDNGRLICEIGVAAIKPAEFVIFRIGQKTADVN